MKKYGSITRSESGSIMIEATVAIPFMLLAFFGIVGIGQYIETKQRLNEVANQVANALSIAHSDDEDERNLILSAALLTALPNKPRISVQYCGLGTGGGNVAVASEINVATGDGTCGYGAAGGGSTDNATCPATPIDPGFDQSVLVLATCTYFTQFKLFDLFASSGLTNMRSEVHVPLRYDFLTLP